MLLTVDVYMVATSPWNQKETIRLFVFHSVAIENKEEFGCWLVFLTWVRERERDE